ncbi:antibiotic biosynthesis monooxygenase family protein [Halovenus rubra]|uniref:Antibiotic biosynthesis monooxygenase family protein n=2 Tax=Halovenus rubra TaxID=869890 RepID=A0ABD5X529_9EURY|nr:antibiotic biosynthesis monooxygenase [Halovenus rubra]
MIVVANRFDVDDEHSAAFVEQFKETSDHLTEHEGFRGFKVLTPEKADTHVSLTFWRSRDDFDAWVNSEDFAEAHEGDSLSDMMNAHPELEIHEVAFERESTEVIPTAE